MKTESEMASDKRTDHALIGISCCQKRFDGDDEVAHAASDTYVRAVAEIIGGFPKRHVVQVDIDDLPAEAAELRLRVTIFE